MTARLPARGTANDDGSLPLDAEIAATTGAGARGTAAGADTATGTEPSRGGGSVPAVEPVAGALDNPVAEAVDLRVGVVGLGNLGLPVAERLVGSGAVVVGYDPRPEAVTAAERLGVRGADSVADLGAVVDIVLVLVSDAKQAASVLSGTDGLTSADPVPPAVVLMATTGPDAVADLAAPLVAAGSSLLDAPVSGGAAAARAGELSLMVGGSATDLARCRPVLAALGTVHVVGGVGAGQSTKLANQLVFFAAQAALQEAVALADAHGVDREAMLAALGSGTGDCWAARHWGFFDETARAYDASGVEAGHRPWHKDLATARRALAAGGGPHDVVDVLASVFGDRVDAAARR